jgi:hypothetical protein
MGRVSPLEIKMPSVSALVEILGVVPVAGVYIAAIFPPCGRKGMKLCCLSQWRFHLHREYLSNSIDQVYLPAHRKRIKAGNGGRSCLAPSPNHNERVEQDLHPRRYSRTLIVKAVQGLVAVVARYAVHCVALDPRLKKVKGRSTK